MCREDQDFLVVGIDPGLMTGIAMFYVDHFTLLDQWPADTVGDRLRRTLEISHVRQIIIACERYNVGGSTVKKTRQPQAERVIGVAEDVAQALNAQFLLQNASDAKKIGSDKALKRVPGFAPPSIHAHNAASQVYAALARLLPKVLDQFVPV